MKCVGTVEIRTLRRSEASANNFLDSIPLPQDNPFIYSSSSNTNSPSVVRSPNGTVNGAPGEQHEHTQAQRMSFSSAAASANSAAASNSDPHSYASSSFADAGAKSPKNSQLYYTNTSYKTSGSYKTAPGGIS